MMILAMFLYITSVGMLFLFFKKINPKAIRNLYRYVLCIACLVWLFGSIFLIVNSLGCCSELRLLFSIFLLIPGLVAFILGVWEKR